MKFANILAQDICQYIVSSMQEHMPGPIAHYQQALPTATLQINSRYFGYPGKQWMATTT